MLKNSFQKLGFTQNESLVYLALLKLKFGTAIQVTEEVDIPKSTVYDTLKVLTQKGLVNAYKRKGKKFFSVNDPTVLKEIQSQQAHVLDRLFPELLALYDSGASGTRVRLLKGRDGMGLLVEEVLNEATELVGIGSPEELFTQLPEFFPDFANRRKERNIPFRGIFRDSPKAQERQKRDSADLRVSKLVDPAMKFSPLLWLWKDKIAMITFKDEVAVVIIENAELNHLLKATFELLWEQTD